MASFMRDVTPAESIGSDDSPGLSRLADGEIVSDRFVVERLAGSGGMGAVYRALDRLTGVPVALKVLSQPGRHDERFVQESRVLAGLQHPAIVRYVAHGATARGQLYLAMQWLEGEDLARRLSRSPLDVSESLIVARRLAEGLSMAHARGLVHRDVKPSNVLLVAGEPGRATLLDFGIVHTTLSAVAPTARPRTQTGTVLGTVGYMSPEQAVADKELDARADVFALGCVLYECLTGQPAFSGSHVAAVLVKVLREEVPRVRQLRAELSPALDDFVARLLAKERSARPKDGAAVLRELEALGRMEGGAPEVGLRASLKLSGGEQRPVSVMLGAVPNEPDRVGEIVGRHGGESARLANGTLLVTMGKGGSHGEQVITAAVCALGLRDAFPSAHIALATGRAQTTARGPAGPVIDHAAAVLAQSTLPGIVVDEVTAGLLGQRFDVTPDGTLVGRRIDVETPRTLLGKPTPCVGREKELGLLDLTLRECIDESVARSVLVTGPAGQGKSRIRHEFVARVRERGHVTILTARADPVGAGSAFLMVRQLVGQAIGIRHGDPAPQQHAKLRAHVADICRQGDFARIADFLGELISVPSVDRPSPELRAARNDPQIMATWLGRSFGDWLAAECARGPLLIVLEDLHWGDVPSVSYLGEGLRALASKPLMVLALARPEVHDTFPNMWSEAEKHELALGRLTPRASERLVRAALGESVTGNAVARIVERADGNAFYLEELIRRVAEGATDTLPETVLALVQSRLERLDPEARRILRAASIFGEVLWKGGVAVLLGSEDPEGLGAWLETLARGEIISRPHNVRYPDDSEYVFRHSLLRDAAYAMLTDEDRTKGHALAAEWLDRRGEKDALTLADHFERGGLPNRAIPWLVQAAQMALDGGNVESAIALGDRGIACGANEVQRGRLRLVQGLARTMLGQVPAAIEMSREAMSLLSPGTTEWFVSAATTFQAGMFLGDRQVMAPVLQAIISAHNPPEPSGPYGTAVSDTCFGLASSGQFEFACAFLKRAEAFGERAPEPDPVFLLRLRIRRGFLDNMAGELGRALANLTESRDDADRLGDVLSQASARVFLSSALVQTGNFDRAEEACREVFSFCEARSFRLYCDWTPFFLAWLRIQAHQTTEAIASLPGLLDRPDRLLAATARAALGYAFALKGDLDRATGEATTSLEPQENSAVSIARSGAFNTLALVALRRGQAREALRFAEQGIEACLRSPYPSTLSMLYLAGAESLHALGRIEDAQRAIREARSRVLRIATTLEDRELRHSYLTNIVANARTLELARDWLGAD